MVSENDTDTNAVEEHVSDVRDIEEGDMVDLRTTTGAILVARCTGTQRQHADPRSGEVRETFIWRFETDDHELALTITEGLKSSPDDPDFPLYSELWDMVDEEQHGYVTDVTFLGDDDE